MTPATLKPPPGLDALNAMPEPDFMALLGDLFEHSPWVMQAAIAHRPFATAQRLHDTAMTVVRAAGREAQVSLFRAHPELAGSEVARGLLTPESGGEQGRLGFDRLSPADHAGLAALNAEYTARFGFPCIVALVRHATRDSVIATMRQRVNSSEAAEVEANLVAIGHITAARLAARLGGHA